MPIYSLFDLKQAYNYMHFRAFYTNIYNIRLGFIKIEKKTGREDERTKFAFASPRGSKQCQKAGLRFD